MAEIGGKIDANDATATATAVSTIVPTGNNSTRDIENGNHGLDKMT